MHYTVSNNQPSVNSHNIQTLSTSAPAVINNQDSSSIKTTQRRKKGLGHRRNNSKGSTASWTPPSLSAIADQEQKRASVNTTSNINGDAYPTNFDPSGKMIPMTSIKSPIPSISANIDLKPNTNNRQLNPKTLKLDLQNPISSQISPTNHQTPSTLFTYALRKSSSSDPEDTSANQQLNLARQRRRRNLNLNNNKISSPSSLRSMKSVSFDEHTPQIDELENDKNILDEKNGNDKLTDLRKHPRSVSFHCSTTTTTTTNERSPLYQQRKIFNRVN